MLSGLCKFVQCFLFLNSESILPDRSLSLFLSFFLYLSLSVFYSPLLSEIVRANTLTHIHPHNWKPLMKIMISRHLQSPGWLPTSLEAWCLFWWLARKEKSMVIHDTDLRPSVIKKNQTQTQTCSLLCTEHGLHWLTHLTTLLFATLSSSTHIIHIFTRLSCHSQFHVSSDCDDTMSIWWIYELGADGLVVWW